MNSALHHAEAIGDERGVRQRGIGCRIGARSVEVRERSRLIDENAAGQPGGVPHDKVSVD